MIRVLGLAGRLRQSSYSRALLRAAQALVPEGVRLEPFDLSPLPLYNEGLDVGQGPAPVAALRRAVAGLKLVFDATLSPVLPQGGGLYPHIGEKLSADGTLTDEKTGGYLKRTLEALSAWAQRLKERLI